MSVTREVVADGTITEQETSEPKITVSYSRKISPKQYESAEAAVYLQVPVGLEATPEQIEAAIASGFRAAKISVNQELGLDYQLDDGTNLIVENVSQKLNATRETPKPAAKSPAPQRRVASDTDALWKDLHENPNNWWDNREDKRSERAPDFKQKKNSGDGSQPGLWLDSKPEWVNLP